MKYTIVKISEIIKLQVGEGANFDGITVSIAVAGALRPYHLTLQRHPL